MLNYIRKPQQNSIETGQNKPAVKARSLSDHRKSSVIQKKLQNQLSPENNVEIPIQKKANNTGLPDQLKSGIESLSGYSMNDVKVHYNSTNPVQLNAHAYAQGTNIHIASGQEKHLPHEAWHVIQQKQGRVKPTTQLKAKVDINDDKGLEYEADVMGAKAMQMKHNSLKELPLNKVNLLAKVTQRKKGDILKFKDKVGYQIRYSFLGRESIGLISKVSDESIIVTSGSRSSNLTPSMIESDKFTCEIIPLGETFAPLEVAKPSKRTGPNINNHLGGLEERFGQRSLHPLSLSLITEIARQVPGVGENFNCDLYATRLQAQLKEESIHYTPLLIVIDSLEVRSDPSITLRDHSHKFDSQHIGKDSHIATAVTIKGLTYVFDNHNPQGVPLSSFVHNLEFLVQYAETKGDFKPNLSHADLVGANKIKVFMMQAADVRKSGSGWRASLLQQDPRHNKAYGTVWKDFTELSKREIHSHGGFKMLEAPKLKRLEISSREFIKDLHSNYDLMIDCQHEMIIQQLLLIHETRARDGDVRMQIELLKQMQGLMIAMTHAQNDVQKQFGNGE